MKKFSLILMMFLSVSVFAQNMGRGQNAQANNKRSPEERAEFMTQRMSLLLDLTEAQQVELKKLLQTKAEEQTAYRNAMQQQRAQNPGQKQSNRAARLNTRNDRQMAFQEDLKKILNEDQYTTWLEFRNTCMGYNRM